MNLDAILRKLTPQALDSIRALDAEAAMVAIQKLRRDLPSCVSIKVGDGSIRDSATWNLTRQAEARLGSFRLVPRRGYFIARFTLET